MAREQDAGLSFIERNNVFRDFVGGYYDYQEEVRQAKTGERKAEARAQIDESESANVTIAGDWAGDEP
jgi:hypothetical protein